MDRKTAIEYFYKRMGLGDIENDTQQLAYETAIDFMEKHEEVKHLFEMEIKQTKEWLKEEYFDCFNDAQVGHKHAVELVKKHIRFCEHILEMLKK